jgi:alpha-N-arabinofuranosidase
VDPPRGGTADDQRIIYRAAADEQVVIKGSEKVSDWKQVDGAVWTLKLSNDFFGNFNPYTNELGGDWFFPKERKHHSGQVYLNDLALNEDVSLDVLFTRDGRSWYAKSSEWCTQIWANFGGANPNDECVEINVRQSVFYPSKPGIDYLTVCGFTLSQSATPWSPPTKEQVGLIGTNWSKGWVIENNTITHSRCTGITLGKYFDRQDGMINDYGFNAHYQTVKRVLERGDWTRDNIGGHTVRENRIAFCEQSGIVGSHGGAFSTIVGNVIHDIHVRKLFGGYEQAGIKLHAPVDCHIKNNLIFNCTIGIWLDWMDQGSRISQNVMYDNHQMDIFLEISHGPVLVDNNVLMSKISLLDSAQGGAYVHNLFGGEVTQRKEHARKTQYFAPHSTECLGIASVGDGDERFYNNILLHDAGLKSYDGNREPVWIDRNVYLYKAKASRMDAHALSIPDAETRFQIENAGAEVFLELPFKAAWREVQCSRVGTETLGKSSVSAQAFEAPDGSPVSIDKDCFGNTRDSTVPFPGPFEIVKDCDRIRIWPLREDMRILSAVKRVNEVFEQEPR